MSDDAQQTSWILELGFIQFRVDVSRLSRQVDGQGFDVRIHFPGMIDKRVGGFVGNRLAEDNQVVKL
jgi:hypothetical protein